MSSKRRSRRRKRSPAHPTAASSSRSKNRGPDPILAFVAPMRWTPGGPSADLEDRRGSSGFGFGRAPFGIGGAIILLILSLLFGRNFFALFEGESASTDRPVSARPVEE